MKDVLTRLEAALASMGDPILGCLRPPAAPEALNAFERTAPARLPAEVRSWFGWRNGLHQIRAAEYELVPMGRPLSLAQAADTAETERAISEKVAREYGLEEPLWDPGWLPLFHDRADLLVVKCAPEHSRSSPVWFLMSADPEVKLAYDNLRSLVGCAAECWESGAFRRKEPGMIEEDRERVRDIWCWWNPATAEETGGIPPLGSAGVLEQREPDVRLMLEQLDSEDEVRRLEAVASLVRQGHGAALGPCLEFLKHPEAPVRWSAAQLLGRLGDVAALPRLVEALGDEDEQVRMLAADALASFGEAAGARARSVLASLAEEDPDETVRLVAADALDRTERRVD